MKSLARRGWRQQLIRFFSFFFLFFFLLGLEAGAAHAAGSPYLHTVFFRPQLAKSLQNANRRSKNQNQNQSTLLGLKCHCDGNSFAGLPDSVAIHRQHRLLRELMRLRLLVDIFLQCLITEPSPGPEGCTSNRGWSSSRVNNKVQCSAASWLTVRSLTDSSGLSSPLPFSTDAVRTCSRQ
ncbi:hypothetical protein TGAM01_v201778 [Trichoderma gamsii]|uniref:Secreted protein n=1 Tax=Trichoderma gamsii TaxID=398673 RepID=A0A2P4ZZ06_9HYPO|nr:hypothetical protein TGAM01_v201778 [Trichoderma gamsii]PON29529.1 hypothetical protein TGAM01_v201778 [Trichoderma gamsii]